jgi:hypothetical protein
MKTCIFIALAALLFTACKKNNQTPSYQSQGAITGVDIFFCNLASHCGGVRVTIKNDPTKNPPAFYYVDTAITQFGLSLDSKFPVNVSLNWKHDPNYPGYIIVSKLKVD